MKIRVLKRSSDELKIEIEGAGHTLCNLVQKKLLEDENVDLAGYNITHPLASTSIIYVRTKGDVKPEVSLQGAVKKARKMNKEFGKEFQKALKNI